MHHTQIYTLMSSPSHYLLQVPAAARSVLQPLAGPVALLLALRALLSTAAPDQWRTLCVWRRILPIFTAYMWFQKRVDAQQGLDPQVWLWWLWLWCGWVRGKGRAGRAWAAHCSLQAAWPAQPACRLPLVAS
jgi:hypothetical protein